MTKRLPHLQQIMEVAAKNKSNDKHVHVVYSKGTWGNREWNYRVYSLPKKAEKDVPTHLKTHNHHINLAKDGWHVEAHVVADRKDYDKTQNRLNKEIIKHAGKDAEIRKKLTAIEKPKEPKK